MPTSLEFNDTFPTRIHVENDKQRSSLLYYMSCVPGSQIQIVKTPTGGRLEWRPKSPEVYCTDRGLNWELIEQLNSAHSNLLKHNREELAKSMTRRADPRNAKCDDSVKPLNWLLKLIEEIYASRLKLFSQEIENSGKPYYYNLFEYTDWAVQLSEHPDSAFEDFSSYMFHFLTKKVGLDSLVKKMGNELLSSIKHFRASILEVEIFGLFLSSEKQKILDQVFFMSCWSACMEHSQCINEIVNGRSCWRRYLSISMLPKIIYKLLKFNDQSLYDRVKVQYNQWLLFADASIKVVEKTRSLTPKKRGTSPSKPRDAEQLMLMSNFVVFLLLNFKAWRREQERSTTRELFPRSKTSNQDQSQEMKDSDVSYEQKQPTPTTGSRYVSLHNNSNDTSNDSSQRESDFPPTSGEGTGSHDLFMHLQRQHEGKLKELITSYPLSPTRDESSHAKNEDEFRSVSFLNEFMDKSPKKSNQLMNNSRSDLEEVDDVEPPSFSGIKNVINNFQRISRSVQQPCKDHEEDEVSEFLEKLTGDDIGRCKQADAHELSDISIAKSEPDIPRPRLASIQDAYRIANEGPITQQKLFVSPTSLISNNTLLERELEKPEANHESFQSPAQPAKLVQFIPSPEKSWAFSENIAATRLRDGVHFQKSPSKNDISTANDSRFSFENFRSGELIDNEDYEIMNSDGESDDVFWCGDDNESELQTIGSYASNSKDIEREIIQLEQQLFAAGEKLKTFQKKH